MLCSISTGKSGSNWLDRLRSSKGFPTGENLDLDHFLANPNPSDSPITNASNSPNSNSDSTHSNDKQLQNRKPPAPEVTSSEPTGDKEWFGIMSNVLSELFNMGEQAQTSRFSRKKTSRKQTNPRICIFKTPNVHSTEEQKSSSDNVRKDKNIPASTTSLNSREAAKRESKEAGENNNVEEEDDDEGEEEKEKGEREQLLGYSRSEVTVIDTSCEVWKVDKLIFRRKNIWKVKDKKGKSRTVGRKKRKPLPPPPSDDNNVGVCNKKRKISSLELRSLKEMSGRRECGSPTNHGQNASGDKGEEVRNEAPDDLTQVLRKRLPRKSGKGSASVILIKNIPTGKKNGAKLAKNRLKDTQRQYKT